MQKLSHVQKKIIIAILADTFVRIARNLKSIADTTVIAYGEISLLWISNQQKNTNAIAKTCQ